MTREMLREQLVQYRSKNRMLDRLMEADTLAVMLQRYLDGSDDPRAVLEQKIECLVSKGYTIEMVYAAIHKATGYMKTINTIDNDDIKYILANTPIGCAESLSNYGG